MAEEDSKDLEKSFSARNETLRSFYNTDALGLSPDEQASLTPILNSLKDSIDRYHELREIAQGGEKKITLVHDHRLDRQVAMARAVRSKVPQDLEQFLREARLTANLAHPNIMPVYNMGLDVSGEPFFSMELVPGDSLKTIIKKLGKGDKDYWNAYPMEVLLSIFIKICDAIAYAHSRNVLHLDIKPDNIRVGEFGEVLVCDWGLARVMNVPEDAGEHDGTVLDGDVLNDMTLSGTMKGTPGFMAPEQTQAYGEKTPQTDVYALGALLYMLLTHELPVRGQSASEVIQNTREGKIVPPRRRKPDRHVPNSLAAVAMKALSLKPEDRYDSVQHLRQEVSRYLSGHPTEAEHAGWITKTSLLLQRHSRVAFVIIFSLVLLAFIVGGNLVTISREKAQAVAARKQAEDNFQLYLKQQKLAEERGENLGEAVRYTVRSRDFVNAPSMIHLLETGLRENVDTVARQHLLEQKGILHFVLQEFSAANECFEGAGQSRRIGPMRALSRKYAKIKPVDKRRLTDQQLADLFNEGKPPDQMTLFYLYYHHMRRRPANAKPEKYLPLAGAVLDKLNNNKWSKSHPLELKKLDEGYHLDLSRSGYTTYNVNILGVYKRNVLAPLQLDSLDISQNKVGSLYRFGGLKLKRLRMAGVRLDSKNALARQATFLKLERIELNTSFYPEKVVGELRKSMEVIDTAKKKKPATPAPPGGGGSPGSTALSPGS